MPHPSPARRLEPPRPQGWTSHDDKWDANFEALKALSLKYPNGLPRRLSKTDDVPQQLRAWLANQRRFYMAGTLKPDRIDALESLPNFRWQARGFKGTGLQRPHKPSTPHRMVEIPFLALPWLINRLNAASA